MSMDGFGFGCVAMALIGILGWSVRVPLRLVYS